APRPTFFPSTTLFRSQPLPVRAVSSAAAPVWSPDGKSIAFVARRSAYVSVGGRPRLVARGRQMRVLGWASGRIHGTAHPYIPPRSEEHTSELQSRVYL